MNNDSMYNIKANTQYMTQRQLLQTFAWDQMPHLTDTVNMYLQDNDVTYWSQFLQMMAVLYNQNKNVCFRI